MSTSPLEALRLTLVEILRNGPLRGARMRPLLERGLLERGISLSSVLAPNQKFAALLAAHSDLLEVQHPNGPGDISVKLKESEGMAGPRTSVLPLEDINLRKEVWQAFTNPDLNRRRFLNRRDGQIRHYVEGQPGRDLEFARDVRSDQDFVEIDFARPELQSSWMREFLETTTPLPEWTRKTAEHLAGSPYESSLNAAFVVSLGSSLGDAFRRFRAAKVFALVKGWADAKSVPFRLLSHGQPEIPQSPTTSAAPSRPDEPDELGLRTLLHSLIDSATVDELKGVAVPPAAIARLLQARR